MSIPMDELSCIRGGHAEIRLAVDCQTALPLAITAWLERTRARTAVFVAPDDAALRSLARVMPVFAPDHQVLMLPAWDNLPYDRARPSRQVTGMRVTTLDRLADRHRRQLGQPILLLSSPEALLQRVPPMERLQERAITLRTGQSLDAARNPRRR